jgi:hypothetical protein
MHNLRIALARWIDHGYPLLLIQEAKLAREAVNQAFYLSACSPA